MVALYGLGLAGSLNRLATARYVSAPSFLISVSPDIAVLVLLLLPATSRDFQNANRPRTFAGAMPYAPTGGPGPMMMGGQFSRPNPAAAPAPQPAPVAGPPAGWHPDPSDVNSVRYWDGNRWTEHVAPRS